MGFIGNMLGLGGNSGNFQAQGVGGTQVDEVLSQVRGGLGQQQNFLNALAAQNGIGSQHNVFNQQQNLADMFAQQAQGAGPNPALAQLANTTGQNINSQAALMAGQRGLNSNPGLAAQLIGQQGANLQQQAGGQAAALRAQQQLAAQQGLQNQQAMMGNLANTQVNQQQNAIQGLNQNILGNQGQLFGMLGNENTVNAGMAGQNAKAQQGAVNGVGQAVGALGSMIFNQGGSVPRGTMMNWANARNMKGGGKVPGKANVEGDSPKNDIVSARLSPGEVVIPRSKVGDPDKTAAFINAVLGMKLRSA